MKARWLSGFAFGAGVMYYCDPQQGRRRRALLADSLHHTLRECRQALGIAARDLAHRVQGGACELRRGLMSRTVGDETLVERVRSQMGRAVSHPRAIETIARNGCIILRGPILRQDVDRLLECVAAVPGVRAVENQLDVYDEPGDVPGLQGPGNRRRNPGMTPASRLLAVAGGGTLVLWGLTKRAPAACVLGTVGLALASRGVTGLDFGRLLGFSRRRDAVHVWKSIHIGAPVAEVFEFWSNSTNFPRFMPHLKEVRDLGGGRSHWVVAGPMGVSFAWNAVQTAFEPNRMIAWRSEEGASVANSGVIRFEPTPEDETRLTIRMSYNPPGGALGHVAALLFGADPKSSMDEDLVRLKSLLESGKTHQAEEARATPTV